MSPKGIFPSQNFAKPAVEISDNAAANLLLKIIGGPEGLTDYLRGQGDSVTRLDRYETALNTNIAGDPRDTTTPNAMIGNMQKMLTNNALSASSRDLLLGWMKNCRTGTARLRAGLPADWLKGDKTGTSQNGAAVDNAIVWPPNRGPVLIASYLSGSTAQAQTLDAAHAMIGVLVAKTFA